jgi:hypothetical protein
MAKHKTIPKLLNTHVLLIVLTLVVAAGGVIAFIINQSQSNYVPEVMGEPNLIVDETVLDYGDMSFGEPVRAVFNIQNTGDQTLRVLGEPRVELVRGC